MLIFDYSNIILGNVLDYFNKTGDEIDLPLLRHINLNTIIQIVKQVQDYRGSGVVLAFDGRNYWRKTVFPNYKAKRKQARSSSNFDFKAFYEMMNTLKSEFQQFVPYKCLEVDTAEADDIIATLAIHASKFETVCIIGSDKDFLQLQETNSNQYPIFQYSPYHKKFINPDEKEYSLLLHICGGDSGDGIPNIMNDINIFMEDGKRQKPFTAKLKNSIKKDGLSVLTEEQLSRYKQNEELIDLRKIPDDLKEKIIQSYDEYEVPQGRFMEYCVMNKLNKILEGGSI